MRLRALEQVARHPLCGEAPLLLRELGLDPSTLRGPARVRLEPREGGLPLLLEAPCGS